MRRIRLRRVRRQRQCAEQRIDRVGRGAAALFGEQPSAGGCVASGAGAEICGIAGDVHAIRGARAAVGGGSGDCGGGFEHFGFGFEFAAGDGRVAGGDDRAYHSGDAATGIVAGEPSAERRVRNNAAEFENNAGDFVGGGADWIDQPARTAPADRTFVARARFGGTAAAGIAEAGRLRRPRT